MELDAEIDDVDKNKSIGIEQLQLEQDTAKLGRNEFDGVVSVDMNRANIPLVELVTKPDFDHLSQVRAFVKKYLSLMTHLKICGGDLENGALRCDVNVSVAGGNRVEMKNLGSTSEIVAAVKAEYQRQVDILKSGGIVAQETRGWNGTASVSRRSKEDAVDYRYFPDVELPRVYLDANIKDDIRRTLPEFPEQTIRKLIKEPYGLDLKHAKFLVDNEPVLTYYKDVHSAVSEAGIPTKAVNNWVIHELVGVFKKMDRDLDLLAFPCAKMAELICMVARNDLTVTSAKHLLTQAVADVATESLTTSEIADLYDLRTPRGVDEIDIEEAIHEVCLEVMASNEDVVEKVRNGKTKSLNYLVGKAMKESQGKVDSEAFKRVFTHLICK